MPWAMLLLAALVACTHAAPDQPPTGAAEGTFREYKFEAPETCSAARFACSSGAGFADKTGCGCVNPRRDAASTMCTAQLEPVCATLADGTRQTASNLCTASLLPTVTETRPGACP
jgi:hypothetical protein